MKDQDETTISDWAMSITDDILDGYCNEIVALSLANPYNYFDVQIQNGLIRVEMFDDIRGIQSSLEEMYRVAKLEDELS